MIKKLYKKNYIKMKKNDIKGISPFFLSTSVLYYKIEPIKNIIL